MARSSKKKGLIHPVPHAGNEGHHLDAPHRSSNDPYQPWAPASLFSPQPNHRLLDDIDDPATVAFIEHYLQLADKALATDPWGEAMSRDGEETQRETKVRATKVA